MHDADSHIMEEPDWLHPYLDAATRERFPYVWSVGDEPGRRAIDEGARTATPTPEYRAEDESQIMLRKNFSATGSFLNVDRPQRSTCSASRASSCSTRSRARRSCASIATVTHELAVTLARAQHRAILDWCSVDPRLLAGHGRPGRRHGRGGRRSRAKRSTRGTAAIQIGQYCTPDHSPSHVALDPVWAMCEEAGVPVLLHVAGAGAHVMPPAYFENGRPPVPDFHGGDTNFKSIDYMSIPLPVMQTLNALVIDGVLQRHPDLRIGVIELGASWVPGWMRMLDSAHEAFRKNEERLQRMEMQAERVRAAADPRDAVSARGHRLDDRELRRRRCACSRPTSRTSRAAATRSGASSAAWTRPASTRRRAQRFYVDNFVDLMGPVLERRGVVTAA